MALMQPGTDTGSMTSVMRNMPLSPGVCSSPTAGPRPNRQHRSLPSTVPPNTTLPRRTAERAVIQWLAPNVAVANGFLEACDQRWMLPSCEPDKNRSWSATVTASTAYACLLNIKCVSLSTFQSRTVLSVPPVTGLPLVNMSRHPMPETWPNNVSTHLFVRRSHNLRDLSIEDVYNWEPSASATTPVIEPVCPDSVSWQVLLCGARWSQKRTTRSTPTEASRDRGSMRHTLSTCSKCPPQSKRFLLPGKTAFLPVSTSQRTTVQSLPPVYAVVSSELKHTQVTANLWPCL
mmetsp:Transcript_50248/g.144559  ORF Transcript_50248/g.144559 Transcript_50248/m.144559 type:complete len:290 (+) Transcript_50248:177-1046(+)